MCTVFRLQSTVSVLLRCVRYLIVHYFSAVPGVRGARRVWAYKRSRTRTRSRPRRRPTTHYGLCPRSAERRARGGSRGTTLPYRVHVRVRRRSVDTHGYGTRSRRDNRARWIYVGYRYFTSRVRTRRVYGTPGGSEEGRRFHFRTCEARRGRSHPKARRHQVPGQAARPRLRQGSRGPAPPLAGPSAGPCGLPPAAAARFPSPPSPWSFPAGLEAAVRQTSREAAALPACRPPARHRRSR